MTSAFSFLSNLVGFILRHPGLLLVLLGVAGEVAFDWGEMKGRKTLGKKISAILLIVGLVVEFGEAAKSDTQVVELQKKTEELRKENLQLQSRIQPREITDDQKAVIARLLKDNEKCPVLISTDVADPEERLFARQIRDELKSCGFVVEFKEGLRLPADASGGGAVESGLFFVTSNKNPPDCFKRVVEAFKVARIAPKDVELMIGPGAFVSDNTLTIMVWSKPMQ